MAASDMAIRVRRSFMRPAPAEYAALAGVPTGNLVDAMGRSGALDPAIKPLVPKAAFIGPALTVRCRPADSLAALVALDHLEPGDVLAISTEGHRGAAVIGDHYAEMVRRRGAVALVTDGMARDATDLRHVDLPTFAAGVTPNSSFKNGPGSVGLAISLGGVAVEPGDILVGDEDGVVVVPASRLADVVAAISDIRERERHNGEVIAAGKVPDWLDIFIKRAEIVEVK
jgi:4-hydroxy-4-methyl-2-oxoglutarate aldolase